MLSAVKNNLGLSMTQKITLCSFATTGLSKDENNVLLSMLKLLSGKTAARWNTTDTSKADVLLVGANPDHSLVESWLTQSKPWVAYMGTDDVHIGAIHQLQAPMRVFPLLSLLQELESALKIDVVVSRDDSHQASYKANPKAWLFADELRKLGSATSYGVWQRAGNVHVLDSGREFAISPSRLEALRSGFIPTGDFEQKVSTLPDGLVKRPMEELCWYVGWYADETQLAPWLNTSQHYRLRNWPDFGTLKGSYNQMRLSSLMSKQAWSLDGLITASGMDSNTVTRFFNACALCGLLNESSAPIDAPIASTKKTSGFMSGLVRGIRSRLGLGDQS